MGLLLDDESYKLSPTSVLLMRGDYENLPIFYSLKRYAPTSGNQGPAATCAAWATSYAGRTIIEAMKNQWQQFQIDSNAFSPYFVYNQIKREANCDKGTSMVDALEVLKKQGGLKNYEFDNKCDRNVNEEDKKKATNYRIIEYREIADRFSKNKILLTKKSLYENKPVVIGIDCPGSFINTKEVWLPEKEDYKEWSRGHALTVVGYDDDKFDGAFEVLNSWGTNWGSKGFGWIKYSDYDFFCKFAFELIGDLKLDSITYDLSGSLLFKRDTGEEMLTSYNGESFTMKKPYRSGTQFKLIVSNNEPAYIYAIGADDKNNFTKIFPFGKRMSAFLPYKANNFAIPGEDYYCKLDENEGTSYFCFFYSRKILELDGIINQVKNAKGNLWQRILKVLGKESVLNKKIEVKRSGQINFKAKSEGGLILPILIAIPHLK